VVVADLDVAAAEATVAALPAGQGLAIAGDVATPADIARIVSGTADRLGRLDVFFQNAGVPQAARPVEEIPLAEWQRIIAVNLTAPFLQGLCVSGKAGAGWQEDAPWGKIVV